MPIEHSLHSPRLIPFPLSAEQLNLILQNIALLEDALALSIVVELVTPPVRRAITMKLGKMTDAPPSDLPWYTYWLIIVKQDDVRTGSGLVGFKGTPDEAGSVEIGYGIDPAFRGKGYMTEAVQALITWAFQYKHCQVVTANRVLKSNLASSHVLLKVGMMLCGEDAKSYSYQISREDWKG